jgi:hypothetical protein
VFDNFHHKGLKSDLLWTVLAEWAAELTQNHIAHVVFVTDNPVAQSKTLSHALPNVPFESIALADADQQRARGYVASKLRELGRIAPAVPTEKADDSSELAAALDADTARNVDVLGVRSICARAVACC